MVNLKEKEKNFEAIVGKSFNVMYKKNHQKLIQFIKKFNVDEATAEDIATDTWLTAFDKLDQYDEKYEFKTQLFTIAKNKAFALNKKKNESPTLSYDKENSDGLSLKEVISAASTDSIEESICKKAEIIKNHIFNLPDKLKRVLILRELDGYEYQDIADELELNLSTVKSQIRTGRLKLQKMVKKDFSILEDSYDFDGVDSWL